MPDDPRDEIRDGLAASRPPSTARRNRAFLVTLGVCAGAPVLAAVLAFFDTSTGYGAVVYLLAVPMAWGIALVIGIVWWIVDREVGPGVVLGALAGAVVGFTLCSGVLWTASRL